MSEPQTEAGRALLARIFDMDGGFPLDPGADILAIEAEAVAAERARWEPLLQAASAIRRHPTLVGVHPDAILAIEREAVAAERARWEPLLQAASAIALGYHSYAIECDDDHPAVTWGRCTDPKCAALRAALAALDEETP